MKLLKLILSLSVVALVSSCVRIDSAYTGLKVDRFGDDKGNVNVVPVRGVVFYNPWTTDVFMYPNFVQQVDYPAFTVNTKDGSSIEVDVAMSYKVLKDSVGYVFLKYRKDVEEIEKGYMATAVYDAYRNTANSFTVDSLMSNRTKFDTELQAMLFKSLSEEGFYLEQITGKIEPPASLKESINSKNQAIQIALQANNKVKQAEAEAKIKIAQAEGEATALRIRADAEAYFNERIAKSITPTLVEKMRIEKWNGTVPQVQAGTGTGLLINTGNK